MPTTTPLLTRKQVVEVADELGCPNLLVTFDKMVGWGAGETEAADSIAGVAYALLNKDIDLDEANDILLS